MTQAELVSGLSGKTGLNKTQVAGVLGVLADTVAGELAIGGEVKLSGMGVFRKRKRKSKERNGRNPVTGEVIKIPAKSKVKFTPAKALKDAVA